MSRYGGRLCRRGSETIGVPGSLPRMCVICVAAIRAYPECFKLRYRSCPVRTVTPRLNGGVVNNSSVAPCASHPPVGGDHYDSGFEGPSRSLNSNRPG